MESLFVDGEVMLKFQGMLKMANMLLESSTNFSFGGFFVGVWRCPSANSKATCHFESRVAGTSEVTRSFQRTCLQEALRKHAWHTRPGKR